jgi:hypothetical protein
MKSSCIKHKENNGIVIMKEDFLKICDNNKAAALLLALFEYWYNIKLEQKQKAFEYNEIAEKHGEKRTQDETLFQWHTAKQLYNSLMGLAGKIAIQAGVNLLIKKQYITVHKNPNPRYKFDKTKFFLFNPLKINADIAKLVTSFAQIGKTSIPNMEDGCSKLVTTSTKITSKITINEKEHTAFDNAGFYITKKKRKITGKRLETFMLFWEAFDYKQGKAEATDVWLDIPILTDKLVNEIIIAAKAEAKHRPSLKINGKTPKMAEGWLSGKRWEDERSKRKKGGSIDERCEQAFRKNI